jgi:hypothetical protein
LIQPAEITDRNAREKARQKKLEIGENRKPETGNWKPETQNPLLKAPKK